MQNPTKPTAADIDLYTEQLKSSIYFAVLDAVIANPENVPSKIAETAIENLYVKLQDLKYNLHLMNNNTGLLRSLLEDLNSKINQKDIDE